MVVNHFSKDKNKCQFHYFTMKRKLRIQLPLLKTQINQVNVNIENTKCEGKFI